MRKRSPMNGIQYRKLRERIGSQRDAAHYLGVDNTTISRRELGKADIGTEAEFAIKYLVDHPEIFSS